MEQPANPWLLARNTDGDTYDAGYERRAVQYEKW